MWRKIICEKNLRNLSQTDRSKICEIKKWQKKEENLCKSVKSVGLK